MCELKEKLLKDFDKKTFALGRKIDEIFMFWQHDKKELENFLEFLNSYHPTMKFTANYSWKKINFLDVSVRKKSNLSLIFILNQQTCINIYMLSPVMFITFRNTYVTVRLKYNLFRELALR